MKLIVGFCSVIMIGASTLASTPVSTSHSPLRPMLASHGVPTVFGAPNTGAPTPPANSGAPSNSPGPIIVPESGTHHK